MLLVVAMTKLSLILQPFLVFCLTQVALEYETNLQTSEWSSKASEYSDLHHVLSAAFVLLYREALIPTLLCSVVVFLWFLTQLKCSRRYNKQPWCAEQRETAIGRDPGAATQRDKLWPVNFCAFKFSSLLFVDTLSRPSFASGHHQKDHLVLFWDQTWPTVSVVFVFINLLTT